MKETSLKPIFPLMIVLLLAPPARAGEIVFKSSRVRAVLSDDATWRSIADKKSGMEFSAAGQKIAFASVRVVPLEAGVAGADGGSVIDQQAAMARVNKTEYHNANRAEFADGKLTISFAGCDTRLTYSVKTEPDWMLFSLAGISGTRPTEVTLARIGIAITNHVGARLGLAWNDSFAVGLQGANMQTRGQATRQKGGAEIFATTQDAPGPKLEGAAVALVGAPTSEIDSLLERFAAAFNLPRNGADGVPAKQLPIAKQSYWFISFGEKDADQVVDYCNQSGIRQVLLNSGAWCSTPGHYVFNTANYPDGLESLKRTVAKLNAAGIGVGMHGFASKVSKTDAYVSPVPDRRFWSDRFATLVDDIPATGTTVRATTDLREWPGSPVAKQTVWEGGVTKHQEVIVDDDIIFYDRIGPEGKWDSFLGCKRGAWKTQPAAHKAGTTGRHNGVDGCINGYIIDQETSLLDEATSRLADIFNSCGFNMVFFDGGEDVDRRRFDYYVSKFQAVAMSKFTKRPIVHAGTIMTHALWHSFARSGTVDTYLNTLNGAITAGAKVGEWPTVRDHIETSVRYMLSVGEDRMPGELGWFGIWPMGKNTDGLQFDEIEYLMCKSLAYGAPISLQASFSQMAKHPFTPGLLEIVRAYEELRASGKTGAITREKLREPKKDFLLLNGDFIEVSPADVAGGREIRAMIGEHNGDAVIALWHFAGQPGTVVFGNIPPVQLGVRRSIVMLPKTTIPAARALLAGATRK